MIYLDNSATTYPKPKSVYNFLSQSLKSYGSNVGRGSYSMAIKTSEKVFETRMAVADFFGCSNVDNVVFTYNCTMSLNMAIKGIAKKGGHFVISDLEHNAVLRPLEKLKIDGICDYSVAKVEENCIDTIKNFSNAIKDNTIAVICTGASNVFGIMPPIKAIAQVAHDYNKLFVLDGAQVSGVIPINVETDGIDILCCSGHKGLYGLSGTGILIVGNGIQMDTLIEGGTGSNSMSKEQPTLIPDRYESGTPNIHGIIALKSGIDFIKSIGIKNVFLHEEKILNYFINSLKDIQNCVIYFGNSGEWNKVPVLSFNIKDLHSEVVAQKLSEYDIAVRGGYHCAPLAHKKVNTIKSGTVRISPSFFTQKNDIDFLIKCVRKIAK